MTLFVIVWITTFKPESIVANQIDLGTKQLPLDSFIVENGLQKGVVDPKNPFKLIKLSTIEGQAILDETYKGYLRQQLLNKLTTKFGIKILLDPPLPTALNLSGIKFHSRGKIDSQITICIISDFTGSSCRYQAPILDAIYKKFKDKILSLSMRTLQRIQTLT